MPDLTRDLLLARFRAAAEAVARERPDVDADAAREVFAEAAGLLHDGLVLDDLDDADTAAVVEGLCAALADPDPGAAVRALARAAGDDPGDLSDREAVAAAYLSAARVLQL
ncbi:hypothetical protein ACI78R_09685 [Geodermatophilus sp. SYSU D01106]